MGDFLWGGLGYCWTVSIYDQVGTWADSNPGCPLSCLQGYLPALLLCLATSGHVGVRGCPSCCPLKDS